MHSRRSARKFDSVPVHILKNRAFARYDEFSQSLQIVRLATDKLDQFMCVLDRARVDDHSGIIPGLPYVCVHRRRAEKEIEPDAYLIPSTSRNLPKFPLKFATFHLVDWFEPVSGR